MTDDTDLPGLQSSPDIDTTVSHSARIWDYWLGGRGTDYINGDLNDPEGILKGAERTLDLNQPTAVTMLGVLWHIVNDAAAIRYWNQFGKPPGVARSPQEIASFFDRLELVAPGVVSCTRWRPAATPFGLPDQIDRFCGVGRKP